MMAVMVVVVVMVMMMNSPVDVTTVREK